MIVLGLDPGYEQSALVVFDGRSVVAHHIAANQAVRDQLNGEWSMWFRKSDRGHAELVQQRTVLVIEQIESFGMAVGKEVFETVFWTGRFAEAWYARECDRLPRRVVKQHLCHTARATDANVRQALVDRFGPTTQTAIGSRKTPGPLFGIKSHEWAALAVAVTYYDQHAKGETHDGSVETGV